MQMPCPDDALVEVSVEDPRWGVLDLAGLTDAALNATLDHLGLPRASFGVSVLACDDARIAALNADFRGKPAPTNVLSWPGADRAADRPGTRPMVPDPVTDSELGDIALAFDTCMAEATAADKSMDAHVLHLLVHSMLHLLGYDHETDADAALMEGTESRILAAMGQPDPYQADPHRVETEQTDKDYG